MFFIYGLIGIYTLFFNAQVYHKYHYLSCFKKWDNAIDITAKHQNQDLPALFKES